MRKTPVAYFVRHGTTGGNAADIFRGSKIDYPLNKDGIQDAKAVGKWFINKPISAVYATSKVRTQDTAAAIAKPKGLTVQPIRDLTPLNVGYLAGEPKKDHENVMEYFQQHPEEKIPGGESLNEFRARTQPPIKKLLVKAAQSENPIVAVVHSSTIHELNHIVSGDHNKTLVEPGGIVGVYQHPQHGLALKALLHPEKEEDLPYGG